MFWVRVLVTGLVAFNVGIIAGGLLAYISTARHSHDVWEIRNRAGDTYYVLTPEEVDAALAVDGMLAVRRLRVLT